MFTSDIDNKGIQKRLGKTVAVYLYVSVACIVITNIYALFGHCIRSASMDFMFLYPLLGGVAAFMAISFFLPRLPERLRSISRKGYNLYNSGIAALTSASMLKGIVEIAGTDSKWIVYIMVTGIALVVVGITCQAAGIYKKKESYYF